MIYRLRYCNKDGVEARVDIQKGLATPVIDIEGTERPFILSYNNDKGDKSGMFLSSSADIEIYETPDFNIDNLKTSNETELSVTHYINNVVSWQGFIIPDFFSIDVRNNPVITMTASDRIGTLKNATLSDLPSMISLRELAILCLNKTGLTLPLKTMADFNNGTGENDFFNSKILTQRLSDTKGRSISCYNILSSILTASDSFLVQRSGCWHIINKIQHEAGSGSLYSDATTSTAWSDKTVNFSDVNVGARRKIIPVASMVGVYHEHGGGRLHPYNYDFSQGLTGWTAINGFNASIYDREILYYLNGNPYYGDTTDHNYLVNLNERVSGSLTLDTAPYLQSEAIPVVSTQGDMVDISLDINITAPGGGSNSSFPSFVRYAIIATNGSETYALNRAGTFDVYDATNLDHSQTVFIGSDVFGQITAVSKGQLIKGKLERDLSDYTITVRIYGSGTYQVTTVNFISVQFSNSLEVPKGTMYKREQGSNYTKTHEIQTVLWGDYLTNGLNGYFYEYPIDDTSSLYNSSNELTTKWTAYNDPEQLPLLQHITRQKSRLFSVAHDLLSAEIEVNNFDPLAIFVSCDKRYTVVSGRFNVLKSTLSVELEEVAFPESANVRDFIYSYFGDGESGIKSIGGISGGSGGGSGGGMTAEQLEILSFWKKDPDNPNTIFTEMNAYSKLELSAYGVGEGGGSGGSDYERLDTWADYDSSKSGWVLSALLGVDLNTRVGNLEGGSDLTVNTTGTGNAITSISKAGTVITATKGATFSLDGHTHSQYLTTITKAQVEGVLTGTITSHMHSYLPLTGGTLTGNLIIQPASQVSFDHGIRLNDVGGWAGLLIGGATGTTSGHDGTTNWWVASNPDDVFMINPLGSLVGQGLDIYRNGDIKWRGNNIYHSGNLSPVTTNTTQTITAQKTFSDGDAVYGLAAKPSIILGGNNTTNAGVIKLWGNTAGHYGLIQATGVDLELSASSSTGHVYLQHYGAGNVYLATGGGNVGIGIGARPATVKLHVAGNILSTGEITAYVASDRRLKHNITPLFSSLDIIDKLNPVSYYWNAKAKELNPMKSDGLDYGLIAQEVENVLPGVVHGIFDDKYKSIDYIKLIPIMIAAIKELKKEINNLKN